MIPSGLCCLSLKSDSCSHISSPKGVSFVRGLLVTVRPTQNLPHLQEWEVCGQTLDVLNWSQQIPFEHWSTLILPDCVSMETSCCLHSLKVIWGQTSTLGCLYSERAPGLLSWKLNRVSFTSKLEAGQLGGRYGSCRKGEEKSRDNTWEFLVCVLVGWSSQPLKGGWTFWA